jgi:hypothetical protein
VRVRAELGLVRIGRCQRVQLLEHGRREEQHDVEGEPWSETCGQGPKLTSTVRPDDVYRHGPDGQLYLRAPDGHLYAGRAVR